MASKLGKDPEWPKDWKPQADADDVAEARIRDKRRRSRKPRPPKPRRKWFAP